MLFRSETDIDAVITSFNQGTMILEAVESLCVQTLLPQRIIIVDDGSTNEGSIQILKDIEKKSDLQVPVLIHYQKNRGVAAARNAGIQMAQTTMVLVLDGDDKLQPEYLQYVSQMLCNDPSMVAASSWMHTFGILDSIICPSGGKINSFLSRSEERRVGKEC